MIWFLLKVILVLYKNWFFLAICASIRRELPFVELLLFVLFTPLPIDSFLFLAFDCDNISSTKVRCDLNFYSLRYWWLGFFGRNVISSDALRKVYLDRDFCWRSSKKSFFYFYYSKNC